MNRLIALLAVCLATPTFASTTAIVGGKIHTIGPLGTIENGTVLIVDGRIAAVGDDVAIPADTETIDAAGKVVTPGLFSPFSQLGLVEVSLSAGPTDGSQRGNQFTAGFDVADAYNKRSTLIAINRIEGVTRAVIAPTPGFPYGGEPAGHVIAGLGAIVNLGDTDVIDKRSAAMVVVLGQAGSNLAGGTRTAAWLTLRNALDEALDYRENRGDFERGMRREYVHSMADLEALQGVINGNVPIIADVSRAADIEVFIDLVNKYSLKAIIRGGAEAWMLADELAAAEIAVIISPTANLPGSFDSLNARFGAAQILINAGVKVAIGDLGMQSTHNARNITQDAGNAVAHGLPWDDALRAITLTPAEIYGVAGSTGSLEVGKAADVVIWPGDPLELTNFPEQVFINGDKIPMVSRQTLLRDRYLQTDRGPPAYRK